MSLEIIARKLHIFTEKGIVISLHKFLSFDELLHILRLTRFKQCTETDLPSVNANSMLHLSNVSLSFIFN